jgi:hypothetical protein
MKTATLRKGAVTYVPVFDCFAKVEEVVTLRDGRRGYRVTNESEGVLAVLLREEETYGCLDW